MNDKPPEEKVTKNTELEYESEVSNPHPEIPDDYEPQDDQEEQALRHQKLAKTKETILANTSQQLEQLQVMRDKLSETLDQAAAIKELLATLTKNSN